MADVHAADAQIAVHQAERCQQGHASDLARHVHRPPPLAGGEVGEP
jgi:hypothetical protein